MAPNTSRSDRLKNELELSAVEKMAVDTIADLFKEMYGPAIKKLERT